MSSVVGKGLEACMPDHGYRIVCCGYAREAQHDCDWARLDKTGWDSLLHRAGEVAGAVRERGVYVLFAGDIVADLKAGVVEGLLGGCDFLSCGHAVRWSLWMGVSDELHSLRRGAANEL